MKIPENADASQPPDSLAETDYVCGECKSDEFTSFADLASHTVVCDGGENSEGD